jgi:hypothetical protein
MNVPDPRSQPAVKKAIPLDKVQIEDRRTQARARLNAENVKVLTEVLAAGHEFNDLIEVYFDGTVYWIGDGFHRAEAYLKAGKMKVPALVREGGWQAAATHAVGANDSHGLRRSRKDLARAIALAFELYPTLGDRAIAKIVRTSHPTVAAHRPASKDNDTRTYTDRWGNESQMNVAGLRGKTALDPGPVNEFNELPPATKTVLLDVLSHVGQLSKKDYAFVLAWLKGHLPPTPKEASALRTQLESEAEPVEEDGDQDIKF